jgi:hypothetical protein
MQGIDLSAYALGLPLEEKLSYIQKLWNVRLIQCPFKTQPQFWTKKKEDFKSLLKQTDRNDRIFFLMYKPNSTKSPRATEKPIECVKSLESYKKYIDGYLCFYYLYSTSAMKLPNGKSVVKGLVCRAILPTRLWWNIWLLTSMQIFTGYPFHGFK